MLKDTITARLSGTEDASVELCGARTLVTGATGGLGAAIARACSSRGADLILTGRRGDTLTTLADELGARTITADLSNVDELTALPGAIGGIDVLISNAAVPAGGEVSSFSIDEIDRAVSVNLRAGIVLARTLAPSMCERGSGHIVFVSSLAAVFPTPGLAIYNATKAALRNFALSLRAELASHSVGVSIVAPGPIRDAGMWADTGLSLPLIRTKSPEQVGTAVIAAIEYNRVEVPVADWRLRVGAALAQMAPRMFARMTPRLGTLEMTEAMARGVSHKR